ncbi:type II toxin-antitoxin system RelE family toxin [Thomasclavelia cocleata]|uniref:type II toxin-antitoxin system RelE family toxin n=1 Tax=Thomasclavelia cocleata TaxID=69824 RepID=UPI00242AA86B|nr:type II toxin-antitoxin system RelE/ParE family toxin [Thomasclavelia cocleata]
MYKVEYSKLAVKQLKKMDKYTRTMLLNWVSRNLVDCEDPFLHGKELKGNLKGQWRYRVGDYRILTEIVNGKLVILVLSVGHRREIYK